MATEEHNWGVATLQSANEVDAGGFTTAEDSWNQSTGGGISNHDSNDATDQDQVAAEGDQPAAHSGCHFCNSLSHRARECPEKPQDFGRCFTCGEEGHIRSECPSKPPVFCKLCRQEGHELAECNENRLWAAYDVKSALDWQTAWEAMLVADKDKDLDDIKTAALAYAKACPGLTIANLEVAFRSNNLNTYLIAKEQPVAITHTSVNFQGEPDQKFVVSFQFSARPRRLRQDEGWPANAEENTARLNQAGFVLDSLVTICRNCGEAGHTSKRCTQERVEPEKVVIECSLCGDHGHRLRDCRAPRRQTDKARECRNCGSTDHLAKECPDKPEQPRTCRNCDSEEHIAAECTEPKDWSRVTCNNCGEKGHTIKRCKQAPTNDGVDKIEAGVAETTIDNGGW